MSDLSQYADERYPARFEIVAEADQEIFSHTSSGVNGFDTGQWPPPETWTQSTAVGVLADAVRKRMGITDENAEVILYESNAKDGWSEYTYDHYFQMHVKCDDEVKSFTSYRSNLTDLMIWLDENPEDYEFSRF